MPMGYRVGSPQAEAAYDRWLDGQADEHMEELYGDDEDEEALREAAEDRYTREEIAWEMARDERMMEEEW